MSSSDANQIEKVFPDQSLYEILEISETASESDIKKAYRRKALLHHPDKGGDEDKFKAISIVHTILSDPEKRKMYDQSGEIDSSDMSQEAAEWTAYFRSQFPKLTVDAIEKFSLKYKFSEEERIDVLEAYKKREGDLEDIMETVILAEEDERDRIIAIINKAIEEKEVTIYEPWPITQAHSKAKKKKPRQHIDIDKAKKTKEREEAFVLQIMANQNRRADAFANICDKYTSKSSSSGKSKKKKVDRAYDIDDDEFERMQATMREGKKKKK